MINVIASGSTGNCEIYGKHIAVDLGIGFSKIKPFLYDLQIVLGSHVHSDHLNTKTLAKLSKERPTLRFAIGEHMVEWFKGINNVDVCELNKWYDYGTFKISCFKLYHDVFNVGWRIFIKQPNGEYYKIFRATDTFTLEGIEAKNYDAYCIESNYNEETIYDSIKAIKDSGGYAYQEGAINSHLSEQQAREFIFRNGGKDAKIVRLHESKTI